MYLAYCLKVHIYFKRLPATAVGYFVLHRKDLWFIPRVASLGMVNFVLFAAKIIVRVSLWLAAAAGKMGPGDPGQLPVSVF